MKLKKVSGGRCGIKVCQQTIRQGHLQVAMECNGAEGSGRHCGKETGSPLGPKQRLRSSEDQWGFLCQPETTALAGVSWVPSRTKKLVLGAPVLFF